MRERLQAAIDATDPGKHDAVALAYGLCNNGLVGLVARQLPVVIPRAHDCITLFIGDRQRYEEYFHANPGTYYYTSGWLECVKRRGADGLQQGSPFLPSNAKAAAAMCRWPLMPRWNSNAPPPDSSSRRFAVRPVTSRNTLSAAVPCTASRPRTISSPTRPGPSRCPFSS